MSSSNRRRRCWPKPERSPFHPSERTGNRRRGQNCRRERGAGQGPDDGRAKTDPVPGRVDVQGPRQPESRFPPEATAKMEDFTEATRRRHPLTRGKRSREYVSPPPDSVLCMYFGNIHGLVAYIVEGTPLCVSVQIAFIKEGHALVVASILSKHGWRLFRKMFLLMHAYARSTCTTYVWNVDLEISDRARMRINVQPACCRAPSPHSPFVGVPISTPPNEIVSNFLGCHTFCVMAVTLVVCTTSTEGFWWKEGRFQTKFYCTARVG